MLRCNFNLPLLTLALFASMVQTAPSQEISMAEFRVDRVALLANRIVSHNPYGLADNRALVPEVETPLLQDLFEQNGVNEKQMHLLHLNLLKLLVILDVIIIICVFNEKRIQVLF